MKQLRGAYLFELDQRFRVLAPKQYIPYNLDTPDDFPSRFKDYFDIVVVDPPFLNEVSLQACYPMKLADRTLVYQRKANFHAEASNAKGC